MLYFDTSYLVRLYFDDAGCEPVRGLAAQNEVASCWHAQAEILCALHRGLREGRLDAGQYRAQLDQYRSDRTDGAFRWLPLADPILARLDRIVTTAPAATFLRAADALHLACAAENGFTEIYSQRPPLPRRRTALRPARGERHPHAMSGQPEMSHRSRRWRAKGPHPSQPGATPRKTR